MKVRSLEFNPVVVFKQKYLNLYLHNFTISVTAAPHQHEGRNLINSVIVDSHEIIIVVYFRK